MHPFLIPSFVLIEKSFSDHGREQGSYDLTAALGVLKKFLLAFFD